MTDPKTHPYPVLVVSSEEDLPHVMARAAEYRAEGRGIGIDLTQLPKGSSIIHDLLNPDVLIDLLSVMDGVPYPARMGACITYVPTKNKPR